MNRELKKIISKPITKVVIYIIVVVFCFLVCSNAKNANNVYDLSDYLYDYSNEDELVKLYEQNAEELACYEKELSQGNIGTDKETLNRYQEKDAVYKYVINHYKEADELVLGNNICTGTKDIGSVILTNNYYALIIMILIIPLLQVFLFSSDFNNNKHRFLYAGENRLHILKQKFGIYAILSGGIFTFLCILGSVFSFAFCKETSNILIVYHTKVVELNPVIYSLFLFIERLCIIIPYSLFVFFIGVLVRDDVIAGIIYIVFDFFIYVMQTGIAFENKILTCIGNSPFLNYTVSGASISLWGMVFAFVITFIFMFAYFSVRNFKKAIL